MNQELIEKQTKSKYKIAAITLAIFVGCGWVYFKQNNPNVTSSQPVVQQQQPQLPVLKTEEPIVQVAQDTKKEDAAVEQLNENLTQEQRIKRFEKSLIPNPEFVKKVNAKYPGLKVTSAKSISQMKINVVTLENTMAVAFMNDEMTFIDISGHMINPANQEDISLFLAEMKASTFFSSLPFEKAIKVVYTDGKSDPAKNRKVAIFADPDCPYCRKMDQAIHTQMTNQNITFYYFMNPLRIPGHEQAPLKAAKIWCSGNAGKAWVEWMLKGTLPSNDGQCKNPVAETKQLSSSLGFNGTPTIIFDNNQMSMNDVSPQEMITVLNSKPPIQK